MTKYIFIYIRFEKNASNFKDYNLVNNPLLVQLKRLNMESESSVVPLMQH